MTTQTIQKWHTDKIGNLGKVITGKTPPTAHKEYYEGEIPFITPSDIATFDVRYVNDTERVVADIWAKSNKKYLLPRNTITYVCIGSTVGKIGLTKRESITNQQINSLVVDPQKLTPFFGYYLLRNITPEIQQIASARGAGKGIINKTQFEDFDVMIPDLKDQESIADVLSTYDNLIENNARRIQILEQMTQAIYTEWFVNFRFPNHENVEMIESGEEFGKIPKGWSVKKLEDVCTRIQAGGTPRRGKAEYWDNGDIAWYTTGELQDNFLFSSTEMITERAIDETSAKIFDKGTILMAIYGSPTVGRLGITTQRSSCNQAALGLVGNPDFISQTYLFHVLKSLRGKFNLEAVGAAQQNISKIKVAETNCLLAPINIISKFEGIVNPIFQELENLQRQNNTLRQSRDLLLPKLVTGEIKV